MKHFTVQIIVCASIDLTMPATNDKGLDMRVNTVSADRKLDKKMN